MRAACFLIVFVCTSGASERTAPVPRVLHLSSERTSGTPAFAWYDFVKSDAAGNLYFHANRGSYNDGTIIKVGVEDGGPTVYEMPSKLRGTAYFVNFSVSGSGEVSVLYRDTKRQHLLVRYDGVGRADDPLLADLPLHLEVQDFAMFESGAFLVNGYFEAEAEETTRGRSYTAVFSPSGQLIKKLDKFAANVELAHVADGIHQGIAVPGDDRNLYLLSSSSAICISEDGNIVKRINLPKPDKDFMPLQLFVSGGRLAIVEHRPRKHDVNEITIQILDSQTGEWYSTYTTEPRLGNMVVSFSSKEGFTFVDASKGHFTTMSAALN
jgi:hypothetical protein